MREVLRRLVLLLPALVMCSKPAPPPFVRSHVNADATKPCLAWVGRALTYRVDPALSARTPGDTERAAVDASFATWQAAASTCSDLTFTASAASENDIVWRERSCAALVSPMDPCHSAGTCAWDFNCWDESEQTLAITTVTYSRSTGRLLEADLQLNGAGWLFTTVDSPVCAKTAPAADCVATDVQNTVTHELGHLLGFDHSQVEGSTMQATAPLGELTKRAIDDGTRTGLCAVYPRAAPSPACDGGT